VCVVLECFYNYGATFKGAAGSAVYAANWLAGLGDGLGTLKHMWSLSIEEQYYLVWPALMMLLLRRYDGNGHLVLRAIAGMVSASWLILAGFALCGVSARFADNATFTRSIELLLGSMLAVVVATPAVSQSLARYATRRRASIAGVAAGVLLLGLVPLAGVPPYVEGLVGWPLIAGLTCGVIYACLHGPSPLSRVLGSRLMTGIGKRSYGVYLWHFPILMVIDARWGLDHWAAKGAGLALTVVVVMLSYRVIERPFLARKNARRPQAAALPPAGELAPANA
jgi:peptidoglycan/LPS O-acetylase OafA/YrhL